MACLDAKVGLSKQRKGGGPLDICILISETILPLASSLRTESSRLAKPHFRRTYTHTHALHPALRPCDHPRGSSPIQYRPLSPRRCALLVLMGKCVDGTPCLVSYLVVAANVTRRVAKRQLVCRGQSLYINIRRVSKRVSIHE